MVKLPIQVSSSYQNGNDPEKAGEQEVEGEKENVKSTDRRHFPPVLCASHQIICHDDWKAVGVITSPCGGVLKVGEVWWEMVEGLGSKS